MPLRRLCGAIAEDILIFEANFDKTDSRNVYFDPVVGDWEVENGGLVGYDTSDVKHQRCTGARPARRIHLHLRIQGALRLQRRSIWSPAAGLHFMCSDATPPNRE
ncbi:MAG: hypothetical protein ACOX29_10390 [Bacillota bacterium]